MPVSCPSCAAAMTATPLQTHLGTAVEIDVCWPCHLIWFDHLESISLSAQSVVDVFRRIHAHRADRRNIVALTGCCPSCRERLSHTNDVTRNGRFAYFRCPQGHGRLISFMQFLREKNFVRALTAAELATLSVKVKQIRCSSCGAGIDIAKDSACGHCASPVAVLDEQAVAKALAEWDEKIARRQHLPETALPATYSRLANTPVASMEFWAQPSRADPAAEAADLLLTGLAALFAATLK